MLEIENLTVSFKTGRKSFKAVDDVCLSIGKGEIMGLAGESGCGKSATALSVLRLIPSPPGEIRGGAIRFRGADLLSMDLSALQKIRGNEIAMIFQDPGTALSPLHRIGRQLVEALRIHKDISRRRARAMAEEWLEKVGVPGPKERMFAYPHELSGGMRQRVMIAMALMMDPSLIIADEPTTALDVTTQAQIFDLMERMLKRDASMLLISHDMGVIREMCRRAAVMYASRIVEIRSAEDIFSRPAHPYTRGLIRSIPPLSPGTGRLRAIPGRVPSPLDDVPGCRFHDRCPHAFQKCEQTAPPLFDLGNGRRAACFRVEK
ncbi:oligopeptide transporter subunit; ATP-binding component of ABC superfamily [Candidatus Desulfarcum epimagneticum]|uniref:Oligopeptide transporter subunit ATP-binding component of ABC superfamily n=1 Tax=uncultured Desulfobacteraceae bacterium TaxID=218296 RepID=A0A484HJ42_9BACT|nr:oligopeptide transporter subunit; ATP-binding component of ABC superfamily [uncultured Desulfobacteraceae bacterium]